MSDHDYLIDTDLAIEHLRQRPFALEFLEQLIAESVVCFSVITELEAFVGARPEELGRTEIFFDRIVRLNVDERIPRLAATFRRKYGEEHGTELTDAMIAATAAVHNLVLVTYNHRHYPMPEVNVICPPRDKEPAQIIRGPKGILPKPKTKEQQEV